MKFGLCEGGTYSAKSPNMAADRCINLFPERQETANPKNKFGLMNTPGLRARWTLPDGPVRPGPSSFFTIPFSFPSSDRSFVVSGATLYELLAEYNQLDLGNVGTDGFPVYFAYNGTKLAISSAQGLYLFDVLANSLSGPILDSEGDALTPTCVVFLDGYFLINIAGTGQIRFDDGSGTWDPLDVVVAESDPDRVLTLLVDKGLVWAFGDKTIQPFQDTGDSDNPFLPYKAGIVQQGLGSPASPCILDNAIFFLGKDPDRGGLIAWRLDGTSLQRVSNHSVEQFWESYSRTDDAISYTFVMQGHPFWQISFPTANKSWRYDVSTDWWHEVGCWNIRTTQFEAHHSINHTFAFGKHLVGDRGGECCQAISVDSGGTTIEPLSITTTCPITDGTNGVAYTFTFAATGGTAPYTWLLLSGSLPTGLTLSSAGVISGTPTETGTFAFTIQATDANGLVVVKTCSISVGQVAEVCCPIPRTIGALFAGANESWSHNSRVGPFMATPDAGCTFSNTFAGIFKDQANPKRLIAWVSDDQGAVWTKRDEATFIGLTDNIVSHDVQQSGNSLHVATQEAVTGRVAHHVFDLVTKTWTTYSEEVSASNVGFADGAVSICVLSTGDLIVFFDAPMETVSGSPHQRCSRSIKTGGVWSAAVNIGRTGETNGSTLSRVVAGLNGRRHYFFAIVPGTSGTPDLECRTELSDGTLGAINTWGGTGLLSTSDRFYIGTPDGYNDAGTFKISLPIRMGGAFEIVTFADGDTINPTRPASGDLIWYGSDSSLKPSIAVKFTDVLHKMWLNFALFSTTYISYDTLTNQAGPIMPVATNREFDANLWSAFGKNWLGTFLLTADGIKFELLDTTLLPTSASLLFADWEAALAGQITAIDEDCHPA